MPRIIFFDPQNSRIRSFRLMLCLSALCFWLAVFTQSPDDCQRFAELGFLTVNSKLNKFKTFIF